MVREAMMHRIGNFFLSNLWQNSSAVIMQEGHQQRFLTMDHDGSSRMESTLQEES